MMPRCLLPIAIALLTTSAAAQTPGTTPEACPSNPPSNPIQQASAAERARELAALGITTMQSPVGAYDIGKPCNANYDEALANPFPALPPLLTLEGGQTATRATWDKRRGEIKALFDAQVYGRYPASLPTVRWQVTGVERREVAGVAAIVKHVAGHVDNAAYPAIDLTIELDVVTPARLDGQQVPVIIGGGSVRPRPVFNRPPPKPGEPVRLMSAPADAPDSAKLLLEKGWGFVWRNTTDIQADNGAGLDKGVIGLVNKGQPRRLDDWGVLRAWAWVDARAVDYLQTDKQVDAKRIGIMGHSRGGKAALVAMADDPRIAIGFISASGAGGANLYRRNYGETIGNLASTSEYHWFAGNFLRHAAWGRSNGDLPFDAHQFIALVAPRPVFIGGGALLIDPSYFPGDAWQDARGMFMAAAAASPAWTLHGRTGLETADFPAQGTLLAKGDIGFRQHEYGHTPAPNWPAFITFASKYFDR